MLGFKELSIILHSLERLKRIMGGWMCGVSLKDRKLSVDFNSFLGVHAE